MVNLRTFTATGNPHRLSVGRVGNWRRIVDGSGVDGVRRSHFARNRDELGGGIAEFGFWNITELANRGITDGTFPLVGAGRHSHGAIGCSIGRSPSSGDFGV